MIEILIILILFFSPAMDQLMTEMREPEIVIVAVGDIMLDRGVEYMIEKHGEGDFRYPFLKIKDDFEADILFGNLESIISDKGFNVGSIYSFRANPKAMDGLIFAGFNIVSVANNHAFDYTRAALEDCLERLKEANISYVGGGFNEEEVRSGVLKDIKGTKIIFLAYTDKGLANWRARGDASGIGWLDKEMEQDIKRAKEQADIVIVSMHFGQEYQTKQDKEQEYWAKLAIDFGADLIIGHHPHVVQPIERYKDGWIAYSLGNFIFDQNFSKETMTGLILRVIIKNKEIRLVESEKTIISDKYQVFIEK